MDVGVQSRKGVAALLSMKLRILDVRSKCSSSVSRIIRQGPGAGLAEDAASRGCDFVCLEEP